MYVNPIEQVLKHSIVYSLAITQPYTLLADVNSLMQHTQVKEMEHVKYGTTSPSVKQVQHTLTKLNYYEDNIDGSFGLRTEHAIKNLQSSYHIPITGKLDRETVEAITWKEKEADMEAITTIIDSISYGSNNEDVALVQELLLYYGYYHGSVDGVYGELTEQAIYSIQQDIRNPTLNEAEQADMETSPTKSTLEAESEHEAADIVQLQVEKNHSSLLYEAKSHLGTPYIWGGVDPVGFDCSGFIQYVFNQEEIIIPRTVNEIWNFSTTISSPSVGDLVFFETYQKGPSHLGLYLGDDQFIHASTSNGVVISDLNDEYWASKYIGPKRIMQNNS